LLALALVDMVRALDVDDPLSFQAGPLMAQGV